MSDTPLTDAEILVSTGEAVVAQLDLVSANHARRLEKALKVAEQELIAIHNAASTQRFQILEAKIKESLSTIAKLKDGK